MHQMQFESLGLREDRRTVEGVDVPILRDAGGNMVAIDGDFLRAMRAANPTAMFQAADGFTTALVVGQQTGRQGVAEEIFRPIGVDNVAFEYPTWNDEHLRQYNTLRGESQPYRHSDVEVSTTAAKLKRRSWAALQDIRTMRNATPSLRLSVKMAGLARRIVMMSEEFEVALLLNTTGTYTATTTITGGNEWDTANGAPLSDVQTAVDAICAATGLQPSDLKLMLTQTSWLALRNSPAYRGEAQYIKGAAGLTLEDARSFFGVGEVIVRNLIGLAAGATAVAPLYTDKAIVWAPGDEGDYDTEYGQARFAVRFGMNDGVATPPYFEESISSWVWPFDREGLYSVVNASAGYLILNTAA